MDALTGIALAAPAGLNAYIPLLAAALADRFGVISLGEPYSLLSEWWAIAVLAVLLLVEIVADKVPAVDSVNDTIQTVVRPAAGGVLALASASGTDLPPVAMVVLGVLLAGGVHAAKATSRPAIDAASGGVAAPFVSFAEDMAAVALSVLAFIVPLLVVVAALVLLALGAWAIVRFRRRRQRAET